MISYNEIFEYIKKNSSVWNVEVEVDGFSTYISITPLDWNLKPYERSFAICNMCGTSIYNGSIVSLPVPRTYIYQDDLKREHILLETDYEKYILNQEDLVNWNETCNKIFENYKMEIRKIKSRNKMHDFESDFTL